MATVWSACISSTPCMAITGKINVAIHPRTRDRVDKARPSTVSRNEWVDEALNKVLDDLCEELGATDD